MPQISLSDLSIGFRGHTLLDAVTCQIEPGQRIALLGRNGAGKTTLLRLLAGETEPDTGQVIVAPNTKIATLPQDVPLDIAGTIQDVVASGLAATPDLEIAWQAEQQLARTLAIMELPGEVPFASLSSGMKRRALLGRALVSSPDVILLDEPTNHLDVDAINWLEEFLGRSSATLIFVTHDRMFLRRMATRILEIDRARLFDWSCDYDTFLGRKEDLLAAEEKQNALFDKRLAEEEAWLRRGIKARRTRNEGRVRALEQMRRTRSERRTSGGKVQIEIVEAQRSGTLVAQADRVTFAYGERTITHEFSTTILRGDKIGVFGPNGAGKTTLLRLLLGELTPTAGTVRLGTNLQVAYFDQLRRQLDPEKSVQDNVSDGYDTVPVGGRARHVIGYLEEFLFSPERSRTPVRFLSGGECNRVLLAKLFAKPANCIVLDEPTNDLDAETLELLEERLVQFTGTVLVVSHDRAFLNNVVTSTLVFEDGAVKEYVGGYDDWLRQRPASPAAPPSTTRQPAANSAKQSPAENSPRDRKPRLSYKQRQELAQIPSLIEQLESRIAALHSDMAQESFYRQSGKEIAAQQTLLKQLEADLNTAFERWQELEQAGE